MYEAVESAFRALGRGEAHNERRHRLRTPRGMLHLMAAALPGQGVLGCKIYTTFKDRMRFLVLLFREEDGELLAVCEADRLGQRRTGAASAVAGRYLATSSPWRIGLLGSGWQARGQLEALAAAHPVAWTAVYSPTQSHQEAFAEEMEATLGLEVRAAETAQAAVEGANLIVTATTSREPVLFAEWLQLGAHINAIGGNSLLRRELDGGVLARCDRIVVDSLEQARREAGEFLGPIEAGYLHWGAVEELARIVAGLAPGRSSEGEITLFKSLGVAIEDVAVAALVHRKASASGVGRPWPPSSP